MRWEQQIQYATISDIGFRRRNNQDACVVRLCPDRSDWLSHGHLLMVADGMGGHAVGELASKIAADTLPHTFYKLKDHEPWQALESAIVAANAAIYERGMQNHDFQRMGTTCSALVLSPKGAIIGHVGDSRVYRVRGDRIDQLSFDHSVQWEMARQGRRPAKGSFVHEARHVITRSLGPEQSVRVDIEGPYPILPGDTFILCSDGLTGHVRDEEIGMIAREFAAGDACRLLTHLANLRGGSDNITIVIARVGSLPRGVHNNDHDEPAPPADPAARRWLLAMWGTAILFTTGAMLALFRHAAWGAACMSASVLAAAFLAVWWWKQNRPDGADTPIRFRAYQTASARLTPDFVAHLAQIESELQSAAVEEGWTLNWDEHELAYSTAKAAFAENRLADALRSFSKAIDALMTGVQSHRRQLNHANRWGRNSNPPPSGDIPDTHSASDDSRPGK